MLPIPALTGIVNIHAQKIFLVTPHLTAEMPFLAPTPMIAPVIVCVVLTGIPKCVEMNKVDAPDNSAQKPSTGPILVILCPIVFTILHPPKSVPSAIAVWHASFTHKGNGSSFEIMLFMIRAAQIIPIDF